MRFNEIGEFQRPTAVYLDHIVIETVGDDGCNLADVEIFD